LLDEGDSGRHMANVCRKSVKEQKVNNKRAVISAKGEAYDSSKWTDEET
jgi:hypothetical protein